MVLLNEAASPPRGSRDGLSGLVRGLLSDFVFVNFSFKRLAGEMPRIELVILFRRSDRSVPGSLNVSALSTRPVYGREEVDSDIGSDWEEAFGDISIDSGIAEAVLGVWNRPGSTTSGRGGVPSTEVVLMSGEDVVKYPVCDSREMSGGGALWVEATSLASYWSGLTIG